MNPTNRLFWMVLLMSLSSCISFQKFSIEVYKPAEVTLPSDMQKVLLVSRNLRYTNDTMQNYYMDSHLLRKDKKAFNVDSLAVTNCLDSLAGRLSKQKRFSTIDAVRYNFMPTERVKDIRPASPEWYKSLCEESGADGLVVLDMFSCFYRRYNNPYPSAWVITSNIWSVYDSKSAKIIDRHPQMDTLIWDGMDDNGKSGKFKIPDKKNAVAMAAGAIGTNYAKHLVPNWLKVNRQIMYNNNPELKKAAQQAQKNNWTEASAIWTKLAESGNKSMKSIALYNLALSSEMNGDTDKALQMINQASQLVKGTGPTDKNDAIRKYATILVKRQNELNKLKQQNAN